MNGVVALILGGMGFLGMAFSVLFLDPTQDSLWPFIAFYSSVFVGVASFAAFLLMSSVGIGPAWRQGALLGLLVCTLLVLQQWRWLTWWSAALAIGFVCLVEFICVLTALGRERE